MKRPSAAELAKRKQEDPESPPDFYRMAKVSSNKADDMDSSSQDPLPDVPAEPETTPHDEYLHNMKTRISRCSQREQQATLQFELILLDREKQKVLNQLQSLHKATANDEYLHNLKTRISTCSRREQQRMLQEELIVQDRRKQEVLNRLQSMYHPSGNSAAASQNHYHCSNHSNSRPSMQRQFPTQ